jgi:hypothetical protein
VKGCSAAIGMSLVHLLLLIEIHGLASAVSFESVRMRVHSFQVLVDTNSN